MITMDIKKENAFVLIDVVPYPPEETIASKLRKLCKISKKNNALMLWLCLGDGAMMFWNENPRFWMGTQQSWCGSTMSGSAWPSHEYFPFPVDWDIMLRHG